MAAFEEWFMKATGHPTTRPWQSRLSIDDSCRSRLIRIPTGQGKTHGVLAVWAWHRLEKRDPNWPRRLVWTLPMRVLTEQTMAEAQRFLEAAGHAEVGVHQLMGGADTGEWYLHPEREAVLIGTQDMLLSRALNRGYAAPRARWPMEFGLLSQDALWVYDEIQLMDVGLATAAQLQAYRDEDADKQLRPAYSWWMSATLQPGWLHTVDTAPYHTAWINEPITLHDDERSTGPAAVSKALATDSCPADAAKDHAQRILAEHRPDTITLVVVNTVDRAIATHAALCKQAPEQSVALVHSRFRPAERSIWSEDFLNRSACEESADRIIVATQVVEAGVDISATTLITDLAPWPSLVQRFGRCARYGGSGRVLVLDRGHDEKKAPPYQPAELDAAWHALAKVDDVGIAALEAYETSFDDAARQTLYPFDPPHLLLRREYDELFDTTPDLTGADLDIGRFIRSGEDRDCQVFWSAVPTDARQPDPTRRPQRDELCRVPFLRCRDWLCDKGKEGLKSGKRGMRAWTWDWLEGRWVPAKRSSILPGRIICVDAACGGYDTAVGFAPERRDPVDPPPLRSLAADTLAQEVADDQQDGEPLSEAGWKTIACHGGEIAELVTRLAADLALPEALRDRLHLAARWHDLGKAHEAFQSLIDHTDGPERSDLAKAPDGKWHRPARYRASDGERRGFRHELASTLALFAVLQRHQPDHQALLGPWTSILPQLGAALPAVEADAPPSEDEQQVLALDAASFDLVAYLVAAHHGKVRLALHAGPHDQDFRLPASDTRGLPIRGVREGDILPPTRLSPDESALPATTLTLAPAAMGLSPRTGRSWRERTLDLQRRYGPAALALLEALLIAADRRASRLTTPDPALAEEVTA